MEMEKIFDGVTLHGFPVRIEMEWPFHPSVGGSDYYVVHGTLRLTDGGPLHCDLALNLAQTVREALPALDSDLAWWLAINTARKALDEKQLELLKTGKRQPVPVSSRCYSFRDQHFRFWNATPPQVEGFVARKVFWLSSSERKPVIEPPGLLSLLGQFRRPEVRRSVALINKFLETLGTRLKEKGCSPRSKQ